MNSDRQPSSPTQSTPTNLPSLPETDSAKHIAAIATEIQALAARSQGDPIALLHLLRTLERVHRDIQDNYFQSALPDSRQAL